MKNLTFEILRQANCKRIPLFKDKYGKLCHDEDGSDWSNADWLCAVLGELGEYANKAKKFKRGDLTEAEFLIEAGKELADVVTYIDILAFRLGLELGDEIVAKFNEVSDRVDAPVYIQETIPHIGESFCEIKTSR